MARVTTRAASARRWLLSRNRWLVLASIGFAGGLAFLPLHDVWVLSAVLCWGAVWGYFVRSMQGRAVMHEKVDELNDNIAVVLGVVTSRETTDAGPHLTLVRDLVRD